MQNQTKKLTAMAMLAALAFMLTVMVRIPIVAAAPFLNYDPKDIVIIIGGFIFGPSAAFMIALVVALLEMLTVSDTGVIGAAMNLVSSCSFACVAAYIYKKNHTIKGAVLGLVCGIALMVMVMLAWNYLLTPIYMGQPREAIAALLLPVFLPFNLVKGGLNAAVLLMIYKPVVQTLRKVGLAPKTIKAGEKGEKANRRIGVSVTIAAALALATCILFALMLAGII